MELSFEFIYLQLIARKRLYFRQALVHGMNDSHEMILQIIGMEPLCEGQR